MSRRPIHVLHDIVVSTTIIVVRELQGRTIVTLVEFGSDEERVCIIEERRAFSRCVNTEEKMIVLDENVKVSTCAKLVW